MLSFRIRILPLLTAFILTGCANTMLTAIQSRNLNQAGAILDSPNQDPNKLLEPYNVTPLAYAAALCETDIVELLLKKGAEIEKIVDANPDADSSSAAQILQKNNINISILAVGQPLRNVIRGTALAAALENSCYDTAKFLIEHGADIGKATEWLQKSARFAYAGDGYAPQLSWLQAGGKTAAATAAVPAAPQKEFAHPLPATINSAVDTPSYSQAENADDFALVIGISKYESLPEATFADRDAEAVRRHLIALGFPPRHIQLLQNQSATRSKIAAYVGDWLPNNVKPDSRVFFYYSGHGAPDAKTEQAYLVPADGDPNYLSQTGYPLSELYKHLNALPAKEVLVALDSCFSGAGGRSVLPAGARPLITQVKLAPEASGKAVVLAAAKGTQISGVMGEQGHGLFTYFLLKGLNGAAAKDGQVTWQTLYEYLKPKVEDEAHLTNRDQSPQLIPDRASNIVLRKH